MKKIMEKLMDGVTGVALVVVIGLYNLDYLRRGQGDRVVRMWVWAWRKWRARHG